MCASFSKAFVAKLLPTFFSEQLKSFLKSLGLPVHLTQGPPGTGKSYLGVVIVRALLVIRKLWIALCPEVGM
jgi:hypothetical protein